MVGFGFGFGQRHARAPLIQPERGSITPLVIPSEDWDGSAASGFTELPADPLRTTAKPAMRLLTPPNQYYTDELLVGVIAGANDAGSMVVNLGLEKVLVHCEGATQVIASPSFRTFPDANGEYRTYWGWWAVLDHDGRDGHLHLYFEAIPRDRTMQSRVIGPYQFSPQARLHDFSVEVAPSQVEVPGLRYKSVKDAQDFLRGVAAQNPLITITEPRDYYILRGGKAYEGAGYCNITASVPVTFAKPAYTSDQDAMFRTRYKGQRFFGRNITFDMRYVSNIRSEDDANKQEWFDGVNFINSGGADELWRGGTRPVAFICRGRPFYTECKVTSILNPLRGSSLVRGCEVIDCPGDLVSGTLTTVSSTFRNCSSAAYWQNVPAFDVRFDGSANSATLSLTGNNSAASRTFTASEDGVIVSTFIVSNTQEAFAAGTHYWPSNVVDWLNALPGWTATLAPLGNARQATRCSLVSITNGSGFKEQDVKGKSLHIVTKIDVHSDYFAQDAVHENVINMNNLCYDFYGQTIFLTEGCRDFIFLNNDFHNSFTEERKSQLSQLDSLSSHVVLAHCNFATQPLVVRTDGSFEGDRYCLIANNTLLELRMWTQADEVRFLNNHIQDGYLIPGGTVGTTQGGTVDTLYADAAQGDFTYLGDFIEGSRSYSLPFDRAGKRR